MSLHAQATMAYGPRVRKTGIVQKKKSVGSSKAFRRLALSYLDEEMKKDYQSPEAITKADPKGNYVAKIVGGKAPLRPSVDYTVGGTKIWTFGHINHHLYRTQPHPLGMSDDDRLKATVDWWSEDRAESAVAAHHLAMSMDPRLTAALGENPKTKRLPLDHFLVNAVANALIEYQSKFYPGDQLGFMIGIHHDRGHAHAHVLVHPLTAEGKQVLLCTNKVVKAADGREVNVQYQDFLKESFERHTRALYDLCVNPVPEPNSRRLFGVTTDEDMGEAYEDLVLVRRCFDEPDATENGEPSAKGVSQARRRILAQPDYEKLIKEARTTQRKEMAQLIENPDPTVEVEQYPFSDLRNDRDNVLDKVEQAGNLMLAMVEQERTEADRPGPLYFPGAPHPVSRAGSLKTLAPDAAQLPGVAALAGFIEARSRRFAVRHSRIRDAVDAYIEATNTEMVESDRHYMRALNLTALAFNQSGDMTGQIHPYLEPIASSRRVYNEAEIDRNLTKKLTAWNRQESRHFQPVTIEDLPKDVRTLQPTPELEESGTLADGIEPVLDHSTISSLGRPSSIRLDRLLDMSVHGGPNTFTLRPQREFPTI